MDSLREATKNTMFDQWLDAVQGGSTTGSGGGSDAAAAQPYTPTAGQLQAAASQGLQQQAQVDAHLPLAEIAGYLTAEDCSVSHSSCHADTAAAAAAAACGGAAGAVPAGGVGVLGLPAAAPPQQLHQHQLLQQPQTEVSGTVAESTNYVPGWEDIFNINQKQLEGAIRRVSNDPNLEPQRKAYLIQNIMVSRYIVTQQRRMRSEGSRDLVGGLPADAAAAAGSSGVGSAAAGHSCCHHHHHAHHGTHHLGGSAVHQHAGSASQQQQMLQPHVHPAAGSGSGAAVAASAAGAAGGGVAAAAVAAAGGVCHQTYTDSTSGILGCKHYRRAARLVAPCCGQVFTCR